MSLTSRTLYTVSFCAALGIAAPVSAGEHHVQKDLVDTAVEAGSFKTLAAALKAADLVGALKGKGPFTVFAPTDEAFSKLPAGAVEQLLLPENKGILAAVLKYHVVSDSMTAKQVVKLSAAKTLNGQRVDIVVDQGKVKVDGATVIKADVLASNGVIHVIDQVIMPSTDDIVATAAKAGSFKTLATALKAASLVETLQGKGPFTVFAPTDKAFGKLPKGTVESLVQPENLAKLKAILTYHVIPGRIYSSDLTDGAKATTVQGSPVAVKLGKKGAFVNGSKVVKADIDASNGVIHVIDSVLLPPTDESAAAD